jgi:hypothetical protein
LLLAGQQSFLAERIAFVKADVSADNLLASLLTADDANIIDRMVFLLKACR